jgi:hypothetical protein
LRTRGRIDANHEEIRSALRQGGATVQSIADIGCGCPDLLVGFRGKNILLECKDGTQKPSRQRLTELESKWHATWRGQVITVYCPEDAMRAVGML